MGKPILFDTISRKKFDDLSDDIKAKRNYQIKETDGSITKHIGGLESSGGGGSQSEYVFDFDISQNGSGNWIATARQGVTYAAVIAACAETKNVYFVGHVQVDDDETIIALVNKITIGESFSWISGTTIIAMNSIEVVCKLSLSSIDQAEIYITPLA